MNETERILAAEAEWTRMAEEHDALIGQRDAARAEVERLKASLLDFHRVALDQVQGTADDMEAAGRKAVEGAIRDITDRVVMPLIAERDELIGTVRDLAARAQRRAADARVRGDAEAERGALEDFLIIERNFGDLK